jgi:hypothetical protein
MLTLPRLALLGLIVAGLFGARGTAVAQVGRRASDQPRYHLELEPHLAIGPGRGPGPDAGSGLGAGVRASIPVSPDGFIDGVNDSIAIGFGIDVLHYGGATNGLFGECVRREAGPAGTSVCTEVVTPGAPGTYLSIPVVMQWNFWFTEQWSAFLEPGIDLYFGHRVTGLAPSISFGGRFRLNDAVALTLRIGAPTSSFGASFFF